MTKEGWKAFLDEYRQDRKENPVETFMLSLLMLMLAVAAITMFVVFIYHFPIPIITIAVVLTMLWKLYKRI